MLKTRRLLPDYPDGLMTVARRKKRTTDFGARQNVTKWSDLEEICPLGYSVEYKREQDYDFAERNSFKLSLKLKTPLCDLVDAECVCVIGDVLYDISNVDRGNLSMYLLLQEVGKIAPE